MEQQLIHNPEKSRFEWQQDGLLSVVEYRMKNDVMVFTHTEVPSALEGKGIAARLAKYALEYARENKLHILPLCAYIKLYVERHPEYQSMIKH